MATMIGVVLSGCGVYDAAEIHEAVLTLLSIDRRGSEAVVCDELDGLGLPGGCGAATNLCGFAVAGPSCSVHPRVEVLGRRTSEVADGLDEAVGALLEMS